jgi:hypothetical protein
MDTNTTLILVIALLALVAVAAFLVFRQRGNVEIKGPLGTGLKVDGSNQAAPPQGAVVKDARAGRNIRAQTDEGQARVSRAIAESGDIEALRGTKQGDDGPKAPPPA